MQILKLQKLQIKKLTKKLCPIQQKLLHVEIPLKENRPSQKMKLAPHQAKKKKKNQTSKQKSLNLIVCPNGFDDPIQQNNLFSCLPEDMEADSDTVDEKSKRGKITRLPT